MRNTANDEITPTKTTILDKVALEWVNCDVIK
jgi:hypothetical protein